MNARTVLVKVDSVMDLTGESWERVKERVYGNPLDGGILKWVWNVAANPNGELLDLRFWVREVVAPETTGDFSIEQVVNMILPVTRPHFHSGEVCNSILRVRRVSLKRLRREIGGTREFIPRDSLASFLFRRWVGSEAATERTAA